MAETEIINENPGTVEQEQEKQEQQEAAQQQSQEEQEQSRAEKLQTFIESGKSFDDDFEVDLENKPNEEKEVLLTEFEEFTSDPLNRAFVEWRKGGGIDFKDFMDNVGYTQSSSDIDSLLRSEIKSDPLIDSSDDDEVEYQFQQRKEKFESLNDKKKEEYIKSLKTKYSKGQNTIYEQYASNISKRNSEIEEIRNKAINEVQKAVESYAGKKVFNSLVEVQKNDVVELQDLAALYTPMTIDEKTGLPKYDTKTGIKTALKIKYFDVAIKEAIKTSDALAKLKVIKDRVSPDAGTTSTTGVSTGTIEDGVKRIRQQVNG